MSLLNTFIPIGGEDVVSIIDSDGNEILSSGRAMRLSVTRSSKKFNHPLENNGNRSDGKIITPIGITLSVIFQEADYKDGYAEVEQLFESSDFISMRTKVRTFDNLIVTDMPHEETPGIFNAIAMDIKMEETQIATVVTVDTDKDFSTVNRGQLQPGDPSANQENQGSLLFRLFSGG